MGTDMPKVTVGDDVTIMLEPDSRGAADELFAALSAGGNVMMPLADMFWGASFGPLVDNLACNGWSISIRSAEESSMP